MLAERVRTTVLLLPVVLGCIIIGGLAYTLAVLLVLGMAAWEYVAIFRSGGYRPSFILILIGLASILLIRSWLGFLEATPLVSGLLLVSLVYHTIQYERGQDTAALDFTISLAGMLYLGWIGAYFVSMRELPNGLWWTLIVMPAVWAADSAAYFVGRAWGRRPLSPRLSPKKTWEGYWAGVLGGLLGGLLFAWMVVTWASPSPGTYAITPLNGAIIGLLLGVLTPLGDLGESLFKREFHIKDSGQALGGHGGIFDRIDSWLWAAVLGYYTITWFF